MIKRLLICIAVIMSACTPQSDDDVPIVVQVLPTRVIATAITNYPTNTPIPSPTPTASNTPLPPTITASPTSTSTPTDTPVPMIEIVIAIRPIPAGAAIPPQAITRFAWPEESVPYTAMTNIDDVINQVALVDIHCFEPIIEDTLAPRTTGSGFLDFDETCPPLTALVPPIDYTMVAVAVQYIPAGTIISPDKVILRKWPTGLISSEVITGLAEVVGSVAQKDILREQPLQMSHVRYD